MKLLYSALLSAALLFTAGCGDEEKKKDPDPKPTQSTAQVVIQSRGEATANRPVTVQLRTTPIKTPNGFSNFMRSMGLGASRPDGTQSFEELIEPNTQYLYLSMRYDDVTRQGYVIPGTNQYLTAELKVDGVSKGTVQIDGSLFGNNTNFWQLPNGTTAVMKELEVRL